MKKYVSIVILVTILYFPVTLKGQWFVYDEIDAQVYGEIQFKDASYGWICSDSLLRTTDGGQTWISSGISFENIFFLDKDTGWGHRSEISGPGELWRTTDGGITWLLINDSIARGFLRPQLFFTDPNNGWLRICSSYTWGPDSTAIYRTNDGGISWEPLIRMLGYSSDFMMFDMNHGIICGSYFQDDANSYSVLKTADGGNTWQGSLRKTDVDRAEALYFNDPLHGWIVGSFYDTIDPYTDYKIAITSDGGDSWSFHYPVNDSIYHHEFYDISFADTMNGWVTGWEGKIAHSADGGLNWVEQDSIVWNPLYHIAMQDQNNGWISGGEVLLRTTNGGISGVGQVNEILRQIYPNPSGSEIRIIPDTDIESIEISDISGQTVIICRYNGSVNIIGLPPGVYVIKAILKEGYFVQKIVKI